MLVKDVMTKNPITVNPDLSVMKVKELMDKNQVGKIPVLDKNGELVGIITRNDLIKVAPSNASSLDMYEMSYLISKLTAEKAMCKKVVTIEENDTIERAAGLMKEFGVSCLPVMKDDLVVGIITESDVFGEFVKMFHTKTPCIRAVVILNEKTGQIAKLSAAIAALDGNIVSLVTSEAEDETKRRVTIKATVITIEQFEKIAKDCDAIVEDIRKD
ncbi:MAG: CBS domain-containing protein [Treponemataceae bacterium]|nr:CBS domain-containing protein [Treponemataceae bacterium]